MSETTKREPLACPNCGHGESLWSDEPASIMYTIKLYRDGDGVEVEYTSFGHEAQDEGTEYVGDIWCRGCGSQLTEADFGIETNSPAETGIHLTTQELAAIGYRGDHGCVTKAAIEQVIAARLASALAPVRDLADERSDDKALDEAIAQAAS